MKNGLIIPCYNESNRLKLNEFAEFITEHKDFTLCFVNDGSSDDTLEKLIEFKNSLNAEVHVYDLGVNQGKAEAVRQGINYMLSNTEVDNIGFIDADLSTGFEDYQYLLRNLDNENETGSVVIGSRKISDEGNIERSAFRALASWVVGWSITFILGLPIKDTQCGAKIFTRNLASKLFATSFMTRWLFDVEIFLRMKKMFGKSTMSKIKELGLSNWTDIEGSKLSFKDSVMIPLMLYKIGFTYSYMHLIENVKTAFQGLSFSKVLAPNT